MSPQNNITKMPVIIRLPPFLQYRISWHIGFWGLLLTLSFVPRPYPVQQILAIYPDIEYQIVLSRLLTGVILVYFTTLVTIPRLLYENRLVWFGFVSVVQSLFISWFLFQITGFIMSQYDTDLTTIKDLIRSIFPNYPSYRLRDSFLEGFGILMLIICVTGLKYIKDTLLAQERHANEMQHKIEQEAAFLKEQLSPHFFFNTLNNLYGLALTKSDQLPPAILQLSDLVRYTLYETKTPIVQLSQEISFLRAYIELEQLRLGSRYSLYINLPHDIPSNLKIAPLLLIVFVENAFKHTRDLRVPHIEIDIELVIIANHIMFKVSNLAAETPKSHQGIGLKNAMRRLTLLYPEKHKIQIGYENQRFNLFLDIEL